MAQTVVHGQPYTAVFKSAGVGFSDLNHCDAGFPTGPGSVIWYPLGAGINPAWVATLSSGALPNDTLTVSGVVSNLLGGHNAMVRDRNSNGTGTTVASAGTEAGALFNLV